MRKIFISMVLSMIAICSASADKISSFLYADFKESSAVSSALKSNGFDVIGEYNAMGDEQYKVIVFTCPSLKSQAKKENRGFAAVQKALVNQKDKTLVLTNPEYFLHAFMQDDYDVKVAQKVTNKLSSAFGEFTKSKDALDEDDLAGYHFMMGMPYYEDMEKVAKGSDLASKLEKNAGDKIVFKLELGNSTLFGLSMHNEKGEASYVPKINGQKHSAFLPYMVLIEDEKAKVLHPKYYLAISYPNLSMGDFMGISDAPDNILEYIEEMLK